MSEQFAFDELTGNGRAVHLHERLLGARTLSMNGARHEFLAGAVLAGDEHTRGRGGHLLDPFEQRPDTERTPHDFVTALDGLAQPRVLFTELPVLERIAQQHQHAIGVERLLEDVVRAELRGFHRRLDRGVAADHHHRGGGISLPQALEHLEPVEPRHLHVEEDQLRTEAVVLRDAFGAAARGLHLEALIFEQLAEGLTDSRFVVNDEDATAHE